MSSTETALVSSSPSGTPRRGRSQNLLSTPDRTVSGRIRKNYSSSAAPPPKLDFHRHAKKRSQSEAERRESVSGSGRKMTLDGPVDLCHVDLGFSLFNVEKQRFEPIGGNYEKLKDYLATDFDASGFEITPPYLLIWTGQTVPPPERCPFMIADLVVVWLKDGESPPSDLEVGFEASGRTITVTDSFIRNAQSTHYTLSRENIIELWANYFPIANAITVIDESIVIELPKQDDAIFNGLLKTLPSDIKDVDTYTLLYLNGPLVKGHKGRRAVKPTPNDPDNNDYIKSQGYLQPGVCIKGELEVTCSVLLRKGEVERLLVPWHCAFGDDESAAEVLAGADADEEQVSAQEEERQVARARQADDMSEAQIASTIRKRYRIRHGDTHIGNIVGRIKETDFALVKLFPGIRFKNEFFGTNIAAKKLASALDLPAKSYLYVDSFVSDRVRLKTRGHRTVLKQGNNVRLGSGSYPFVMKAAAEIVSPGAYVTIEQKLLDESVHQLIGTSGSVYLRDTVTEKGHDSICGSVALWTGAFGEKKDHSEEGIVMGVMHWVNQMDKGDGMRTLLCLADDLKPLIDAGWQVAT